MGKTMFQKKNTNPHAVLPCVQKLHAAVNCWKPSTWVFLMSPLQQSTDKPGVCPVRQDTPFYLTAFHCKRVA